LSFNRIIAAASLGVTAMGVNITREMFLGVGSLALPKWR